MAAQGKHIRIFIIVPIQIRFTGYQEMVFQSPSCESAATISILAQQPRAALGECKHFENVRGYVSTQAARYTLSRE